MVVRPVTHVIGLCAGVGGLELGVQLGEHLRGRDARGVCYVEREAAGAASLVASMHAGWLHPAPVWSDLATFNGKPWRGRVHCVASGDPCQGNSVAGTRLGADDPRFLIPHVLRIMGAVRPHRLFRENVTGNAAGQLSALVAPLEDMGYRVAAGIFSSGRTGNSHGRERLIVMADADGQRDAAWADVPGVQAAERPDGVAAGPRDALADPAGWRRDARIEEPAGEVVYLSGSGGPTLAGHGGGELVDAGRSHVEGRRGSGDPGRWEIATGHAGLAGGAVAPAVLPGPSDGRWAGILDHWPQLAPAVSKEEAQSLLRGGFDAVAHRIERLRAIGNGVDPVVGATAWLRLGALLAANRAGRAGSAAVRGA